MRATRALIYVNNLIHNIQTVRNIAGAGRRICMPVKADAYGHGAVWISRFALEAGVEYLAVAAVSEGAQLRKAGITAPILLLSIPLPEEFPEIIEYGLIILVADREFAEAAEKAAAGTGKRLAVHLKIDTGMGRIGVRPEEAAELASWIASRPGLEYAGTATHLAVSDSPEEEDTAFTNGQIAAFTSAVEAIRAAGVDPGIVHAANSGAVLLHRDALFDMVRPGIMLYGYSPISGDFGPVETLDNDGNEINLEPVMEFSSRVVYIKKIKKGETVSYGRKWTALVDTWIATIPAGYGDGLPRSLGGYFSVQIGNAFYPLIGRICMDQCMVNLGPETEIKRWDKVTIFGGSSYSAADIAAELGTIPYEITCNINRRVPRVYYK
jgi:alanine racemase